MYYYKKIYSLVKLYKILRFVQRRHICSFRSFFVSRKFFNKNLVVFLVLEFLTFFIKILQENLVVLESKTTKTTRVFWNLT